ncbi:hypothetical protein [Mycobacterium senriense]|uniref:hypothetical protein n=1 Tax=Mycobacterium senriense TaxID=2775496 RepID=UPI001C7EF081|nr:hypothetical protein [Mycobacterium senriense]
MKFLRVVLSALFLEHSLSNAVAGEAAANAAVSSSHDALSVPRRWLGQPNAISHS